MDDIDPFATQHQQPTAARPLLGLTILVVEDSRYSCEAMRLLCLRSGARIRRADCLRSARRHLQVYRPSVLIVDLGLPDGSGADLIRELSTATPRVDAIIGTSGDTLAEETAMKAGADGFLAKPLGALAVFQETITRLLPNHRPLSGPRCLPNETVRPDPVAFQDDMAHAADVLADIHDTKTTDYAVQFVAAVASSAADETLEQAAKAVQSAQRSGKPVADKIANMAGLVQERLARKVAI